MRKIVLTDIAPVRANLLPLSFTRPVAEFRCGILTVRRKWELLLPGGYSYLTEPYLQEKYPLDMADGDEALFVASNVLPTASLAERILKADTELLAYQTAQGERRFLAFKGKASQLADAMLGLADAPMVDGVESIEMIYDVFLLNGEQICRDFALLTAGRASAPLGEGNTLIGDPSRLFLEDGAKVNGAIINVTAGPVHIGRDAEVMEGSCLRGPISLGEHSAINMGAKVYPATTVGPWSKVGGELNNAVIFGYSNKAHDGFLGNAVVGEWCNLGAGCVASNLKNDYTPIRLWNYPAHRFLRTGLQFCGLIMADHSKAGINTMFNTATMVGVGCNIHGSGFPRNYIASFSEGGTAGFARVPINKVFEIGRRVMARRHVELTEADQRILTYLYDNPER